jgi:hypothetical protein
VRKRLCSGQSKLGRDAAMERAIGCQAAWRLCSAYWRGGARAVDQNPRIGCLRKTREFEFAKEGTYQMRLYHKSQIDVLTIPEPNSLIERTIIVLCILFLGTHDPSPPSLYDHNFNSLTALTIFREVILSCLSNNILPSVPSLSRGF